MQDKRLLRQIKKNLGSVDFESDWGAFLQWLSTASNPPPEASLATRLPELLESVEKAYQQDEKMRTISDHSLAVSSSELHAANTRILESKRLIEELLDSLDEGFLVLDANGHCGHVVSRKAKVYLESDPAGKHFTEILRVIESEKAGLLEWWDYLFSGLQDFSQLVDLAPEFYPHSDSNITIKLEFKPIFDKKKLQSVILISKDISEEVKAKKQSERNLTRLEMVQSRYQNAENFLQSLNLVNETTDFIKTVAKEGDLTNRLGDLRRSLHTLKGAMLMVSIAPLANLTHKIETEFDECQSLGKLDSAFLDKIVGRLNQAHHDFVDQEREPLRLQDIKSGTRSITNKQLQDFQNFLATTGAPSILMDEFQRQFVYIGLDDAFLPLKEQGLKTAANQGKQCEIIIQANGSERVNPEVLTPLVQNLSHILNNCVDHGIEEPADREFCGKAATGKIRIEANLQGLVLNINITDDGRGIDIATLKSKSISRGLISDQASDEEVLQQIFAEGLSTRENVSLVSGRGVGLSALKHFLQENNGTISVTTKIGFGTHFSISLQLQNNPGRIKKAS